MRIGIVGCGLIGQRRAAIVRGIYDDELVIVADVEEARAQAVAAEMGCLATTDWREVVVRDDVDAVIVSTTNNWLVPITIAALQNGRHVLCEKPPGRNPEEAQRMMEAAQASGRKLKIGFNHRHHAAVWKAKEIFDQGGVGELLFIRCRYGHGGRPGYEKEWRADPEVSGGGELLDQGVHAVDLFRWFLGDFTEAFGFTATYVWGRTEGGRAKGENGRGKGESVLHSPSSILHSPSSTLRSPSSIVQAEDNGFALFRTAGGQVASLHASWTQWKNLFSFEIFGQDGYLIVEGLGGSYGPEQLRVGRRKRGGGPPEQEVLELPGPDPSWEAEWQEFVSAIRETREPWANGHDGWQVMRMVDAVYESARTGQVVHL